MERANDQKAFEKNMIKWKYKIIDLYIIRTFLSTFFFSLVLILSISVIFDLSEKIDNFMENNATWKLVVFNYYFNFIPYFAVLFSSLFTFITVIFFTSRMAYRSEIIAIISNGMSFHRLLVPYFFSALVIALFSFILSDFVIPHANIVRLDFEEQYIHNAPRSVTERDIHRQIQPGVYIYMESYSTMSDIGHKFSMEKYVNGELVSKLISDYIKWDSTINKWVIRNYYIRDINGMNEVITTGKSIDTTLAIQPADFKRRLNFVETMNLRELNAYIKTLEMQGESNVVSYQIERQKRYAFPFSTFILTLIGVSVSSRKVKGGIGMQIGIGLLVAFSYILFMQFSSQFAIIGSLNPVLAVWIPNLGYAVISLLLYRMAPK
jgi:lipopolysaccharide export system permease protein